MLLVKLFFTFITLITAENTIRQPFLLENSRTKERIIQNETNRILPIASLTKLFTTYLVLKQNSFGKKILIKENSPNFSLNPKAAKFRKGEIYSTVDIIKSMLITSSNQAALGLIEAYFGNEKNFLKQANLILKKDFPDTNIGDPSGLSNQSTSNIENISKLLDFISEDKLILKILEMKESKIKSEQGEEQILKSTIELDTINRFEIIGKTGSTKKAGKCFTGFLRKKNQIYKLILLNSENIYKDIEFAIEIIEKNN